MSQETAVRNVHGRVSSIVRAEHTALLVAAYFEPGSGFAGAMFDGCDKDGLLQDSHPDRFTSADIVAASLLDVRFGPAAVRELLSSAAITASLRAVPQQMPLWDLDRKTYDLTNALWELVRALPGVGDTRTSKLLSRKRPHLVPVVDSVIADALGFGADIWWTLAEVLKDEELRASIDSLRPHFLSPEVSTLRLLDVAVWMSHSRSKAAVKVQHQVGAPVTRQL